MLVFCPNCSNYLPEPVSIHPRVHLYHWQAPCERFRVVSHATTQFWLRFSTSSTNICRTMHKTASRMFFLPSFKCSINSLHIYLSTTTRTAIQSQTFSLQNCRATALQHYRASPGSFLPAQTDRFGRGFQKTRPYLRDHEFCACTIAFNLPV